MSEESLKYGNIKKIKKYQSPESGIMTEIIMFFVFSLLLILSWLGLIKLIKEDRLRYGIQEKKITSTKPAQYYNLIGQRINKPQKGLYILDNKKYFQR